MVHHKLFSETLLGFSKKTFICAKYKYASSFTLSLVIFLCMLKILIFFNFINRITYHTFLNEIFVLKTNIFFDVSFVTVFFT